MKLRTTLQLLSGQRSLYRLATAHASRNSLLRIPRRPCRGGAGKTFCTQVGAMSAPPTTDGAVNGEESEVASLRRQLTELKALAGHRQHLQEVDDVAAPYSRTYGRTLIATILGAADGGLSLVGQTIRVGGWVKTGREAGAGAFAFLEVNDGSTFANLQAMVTKEVAEETGGLKDLVPTSTCVLLEGQLSETPAGTKQKVELKATRVVYLGRTNAAEYPLAKKKQSYEYLREKAHLRPRTNTIGAVARIRNAMAFATHSFFQQRGFLYIHTPLVTTSDCEGAGEMFQVTTLMHGVEEVESQPSVSAQDLQSLQQRIAEQGEAVKAAKAAAAADKGNKELAAAAKQQVEALLQLKADLQKAEELSRYKGGLPRLPSGSVDYAKDFFGKPAYLTVSGQLNAEYYACALSNVYTFGPTFRAENSHTSRHLAEFWMIEPEIAFCDLEDDMQCAEDYVQFCCKFLLDNCRPDLEFMAKMVDKQCIQRLEAVAHTPFKRISYTEAVQILQDVIAAKKKKFEYKVEWGIDLQSEHERYLTEEVFKQPVIVYNYPKDIKAFYMRLNDDGKTVAAMDVLVPKVGELIGGSQREERLEVLEERLKASGMPLEPYAGYLDLRRYGTVPHSGFGLGFERLILFATGLDNIREVIPFPRWPGHADF